jgi:predicted dehydrogenase
MADLRLGVIGFGGRLSSMVNGPMLALEPELRVVGVVDPDEAGARGRLLEQDREARFCDSIEDLVQNTKPDALAIGTRCNLHTPYAIEAKQYGLPIFLEKPVANSMEQAFSLESAYEKASCEVVVSFPLRVSPLCELAKQRLENSDAGKPEHVLAVNYVPYGTCYFDCFYRDFSVTQGLFLQKATHDFDYLMYLMGGSITRVAAMGSYGRVFGGAKRAGLKCSGCEESDTCQESPQNRRRNNSGGETTDHWCLFSEDIGTPQTGMNEDSSSALLGFSSGAQGVYTQVFYTRRDAATRGPIISGYHGTLSFDWYTNVLKLVHHHAPFTETIRADSGMSHFGGDLELARNFLEVARGTAKSKTPVQTGIQSVYACLAAKESAETGTFVKVRQVGGT